MACQLFTWLFLDTRYLLLATVRSLSICLSQISLFVCCQYLYCIKVWVITSGSVHKVLCDNFVLGFVNLFAHFAVSPHINASPSPCKHWKWVHMHLNESKGTQNKWHCSQFVECVVRREQVFFFYEIKLLLFVCLIFIPNFAILRKKI